MGLASFSFQSHEDGARELLFGMVPEAKEALIKVLLEEQIEDTINLIRTEPNDFPELTEFEEAAMHRAVKEELIESFVRREEAYDAYFQQVLNTMDNWFKSPPED